MSAAVFTKEHIPIDYQTAVMAERIQYESDYMCYEWR